MNKSISKIKAFARKLDKQHHRFFHPMVISLILQYRKEIVAIWEEQDKESNKEEKNDR